MSSTVSGTPPAHPEGEIKRRDFLFLAAGALTVVGAATAVWPFIDQMNPDKQTIALGVPVDVDVSGIEAGQQIIVAWRDRPVFILHRTPENLKTLKEPQVVNDLRDPDSKQMQQPPYAANWHRSINPEYLVVVGICTHLGCIPHLTKAGAAELGASWQGGYFCPCHGSKYDLSARVFEGVPAPLNLPVPPYHFVDPKTVRIGANPKGSNWSFNAIEQI